MKPLSFLICPFVLLFALLASCHDAPRPSYIPLTAATIYVMDSVKMAAGGGDEKAAGKLLQQAVEVLKKGGDTAKSIDLFKQSILLKPTAKAYYELAGVLVATRQYAEAIGALHITEKLGFTPLANVMYRYTLAYSNIAGDKMYGDLHDSSLYYMELTIQMGYARPQQFLRKDLFPALYASSRADDIYNEVVAAGSGHDKDKTLWEIYKSHFFPIQLPLVIDAQWIRDHRDMNNVDVSFEFDKFIPAMQDDHWEREPDYVYYYVGLVTENPAWSAMIYSIEPAEQEDTPIVISFYLTTYSNGGNIIDTMLVAGSPEPATPFKLFSIQSSLQFSVQDFVYTSDSTVSGSNDSTPVRHRNSLPAATFRIAANGKFEKVEALTLR